MATTCDYKDSASAFQPADRKCRHLENQGTLSKIVDGTRSSAAVCLYDVGKPSIKG